MLGEDGKKIKAISCELSAVSCKLTILLRFKSLRQASILCRTDVVRRTHSYKVALNWQERLFVVFHFLYSAFKMN